MMNKRERERERESAERNKKEKEGETLGVLSLFFFLPVVSFFANTRDDREQSRTFYVSTQLLVLVLVLLSSSSRRRLSRACSEKKVMTKREIKPFFGFEFQFFSSLSSQSPF